VKAAFTKLLTQSGLGGVKTPDVPPLDDNTMIAVRFSGGGCLNGRLQWSAPKRAALQCAQILMSEPVDPSAEFNETHLDGYQEFLRQAAGEAAVAWKQARGKPAELVHQTETKISFETQSSISFSLDTDKTTGLSLRLDLDAEMVTSVNAPPAAEEPAAAESAGSPAETVAESAVGGLNENASAIQVAPSRGPSSNLDMILDVQLDAIIRFGEREMLLQDVFGLMPGAVVELDQLVNEPAELLVAGRVVAKGEVVVVDGNFGLRVTEVLSRAQRAEAISWG
jgi:flagellar motor switch protein FliN/FliY